MLKNIIEIWNSFYQVTTISHLIYANSGEFEIAYILSPYYFWFFPACTIHHHTSFPLILRKSILASLPDLICRIMGSVACLVLLLVVIDIKLTEK